jgi:hypothetical protein
MIVVVLLHSLPLILEPLPFLDCLRELLGIALRNPLHYLTGGKIVGRILLQDLFGFWRERETVEAMRNLARFPKSVWTTSRLGQS